MTVNELLVEGLPPGRDPQWVRNKVENWVGQNADVNIANGIVRIQFADVPTAARAAGIMKGCGLRILPATAVNLARKQPTQPTQPTQLPNHCRRREDGPPPTKAKKGFSKYTAE